MEKHNQVSLTHTNLISPIFLNVESANANQVIDMHSDANITSLWEIKEHRKMDDIIWDVQKLSLYMHPLQQGNLIDAKDLKFELEKKRLTVFNANLLDYLLANSQLIPAEWKSEKNGNSLKVFFWGTIYSRHTHDNDNMYVRYLYYRDNKWQSNFHWLERSCGVFDYSLIAR